MRPSWDQYFMDLARSASTRATCDRKHVGAVIVRDRKVLALGYNGSVRGLPHCDDVGHLMEDGHCVATIHAEVNAILQARCDLTGATIYTTAYPCWPCFRQIAQAGIKRVVYAEAYRPDRKVWDSAMALSIEIWNVP